MQIFQSRYLSSCFSTNSFNNHCVCSFNNLYVYVYEYKWMGWISFIVYLVNTSVTFINVLISSFRYSAATVQDLSTGLWRAIYKEQLFLHQDILFLNCFYNRSRPRRSSWTLYQKSLVYIGIRAAPYFGCLCRENQLENIELLHVFRSWLLCISGIPVNRTNLRIWSFCMSY